MLLSLAAVFNAANDVHGHTVGDAVLKAVAEALQADPQVHAFRLGGEEFVLLMRREDAQAQAERRRQAIPAIVANAVPGLGRPVTASMGMTAAPPSADEEFVELYKQADRLLYNAKLAGRNRTKIALMEGSKNDADPVFDTVVRIAGDFNSNGNSTPSTKMDLFSQKDSPRRLASTHGTGASFGSTARCSRR